VLTHFHQALDENETDEIIKVSARYWYWRISCCLKCVVTIAAMKHCLNPPMS